MMCDLSNNGNYDDLNWPSKVQGRSYCNYFRMIFRRICTLKYSNKQQSKRGMGRDCETVYLMFQCFQKCMHRPALRAEWLLPSTDRLTRLNKTVLSCGSGSVNWAFCWNVGVRRNAADVFCMSWQVFVRCSEIPSSLCYSAHDPVIRTFDGR